MSAARQGLGATLPILLDKRFFVARCGPFGEHAETTVVASIGQGVGLVSNGHTIARGDSDEVGLLAKSRRGQQGGGSSTDSDSAPAGIAGIMPVRPDCLTRWSRACGRRGDSPADAAAENERRQADRATGSRQSPDTAEAFGRDQAIGPRGPAFPG
ncbi:hypothetical protein ACIPSA_31275 [Streptomyces sp. NPDC086549]|uniref:hypothetical protein n=1 Tax=Streptomyces sp. NPDC086549 TaxID=3365752 RepID=UPI00382846FF